MKQLFLSSANKVIAGVCGGIGEYANIDPVIIRLIWLFTISWGGAGIFMYLIAWIVIPRQERSDK